MLFVSRLPTWFKYTVVVFVVVVNTIVRAMSIPCRLYCTSGNVVIWRRQYIIFLPIRHTKFQYWDQTGIDRCNNPYMLLQLSYCIYVTIALVHRWHQRINALQSNMFCGVGLISCVSVVNSSRISKTRYMSCSRPTAEAKWWHVGLKDATSFNGRFVPHLVYCIMVSIIIIAWIN